MPTVTENRETTNPTAMGAPPPGFAVPAGAAGARGADVPANPTGTAPVPVKTALAVRESGEEPPAPDMTNEDTRLQRLPMQLHVMVKVHSFRVQDLLSMEKGTVVETVHEHTQDVPVRCGGALLLWSEFEVLDQRLAVRVTRLA
jgi:flagellar motor switch/type III secretory pathway protein FliN